MSEKNINVSFRVQQLLKSRGIKPSVQRMKILEFIWKNRSHPSAEAIFRSLRGLIPTLSRTTVYNTLGLLTEKGILRSLQITENELHYDLVDSVAHSHFFCCRCKQIFDVTNVPPCRPGQMVEGHRIEKSQLILTGTCRHCLESD